MEKYVVKIEMREPLSTSEAKKKYSTKADMNKDTYARGNQYTFGYTNDIGMAKSFSKYSDAENYAHSCMFNYWGNKTTIAKVVKCKLIMTPLESYDIKLSTLQKIRLIVVDRMFGCGITFEEGELEKFAEENKDNDFAMGYYNDFMEKFQSKI